MKEEDLKGPARLAEELKHWDEPDGSRFLMNTFLGCALLTKEEFKTPENRLLAKCFYCQAIEHDNIGECPDTDCPLYSFVCSLKRLGKIIPKSGTVN